MYLVACQRRRYWFPLDKTIYALSKPHKESTTSETGVGTCFQTTIAGSFSSAGFFSEMCINTGVLTYSICYHNNNTLYVQNILKWRYESCFVHIS